MSGRLATVVVFVASLAAGEEARYLVSGDDLPVTTASNGYSQVVYRRENGRAEVRVATSLSPIGSTGTYQDVTTGNRPEVPDGFSLPSDLHEKLRPDIDAWEAATLILDWAADRIIVDIEDLGSQDALSVLERGRGRCSGLANAVVALLRAAGYEARTVSGLLVGDRRPIPHRWIECRLPGAGWVASDPTLGLWTVTPRHMVFPDTVTGNPEVQVLAVSDDGLDRLPRFGGRIVRPNRGANLVCRLAPPMNHSETIAVLRSGADIRRARFDPVARFSNLLPGVWQLEVVSGEHVVHRRRFELKSGDFMSYVATSEAEAPPREVER
jgi:hypothetical protein